MGDSVEGAYNGESNLRSFSFFSPNLVLHFQHIRNMGRTLLCFLGLLASICGIHAIGQDTCVTFTPSNDAFAVVNSGKATSIIISPEDWPGVQLAAADFAADIKRVTGKEPSLTNFTVAGTPSNTSSTAAASKPSSSSLIIVGTLGKSPLISQIVNNTGLDVSSIQGKWEAFLGRVVKNPLPGVDSAYVIIGADKRGTIYALYDHSEQFGE